MKSGNLLRFQESLTPRSSKAQSMLGNRKPRRRCQQRRFKGRRAAMFTFGASGSEGRREILRTLLEDACPSRWQSARGSLLELAWVQLEWERLGVLKGVQINFGSV
uniref:Uncharacterized protein n=1 Tax=Steinernema glaseri TaxID=37863 RepID=A0A1I7YIB4_9BILA